MTIQNLLDMVDRLYPNSESNADKVANMNLAQEDISPYFGIIVEDDSTVTVEDQDEYSFPAGLLDATDIISLGIGNQEVPDDRYDYTRYHLVKSEEDGPIYNSYYQVIDSAGAKKLVIYPVPSTDDLPIVIRYRSRLPALSTTVFTGSPAFDSNYHSMLAYFCIAQIAGAGDSPNEPQHNRFMRMYEGKLEEIWRKAMDDEIENRTEYSDNPQWHGGKRFVKGY